MNWQIHALHAQGFAPLLTLDPASSPAQHKYTLTIWRHGGESDVLVQQVNATVGLMGAMWMQHDSTLDSLYAEIERESRRHGWIGALDQYKVPNMAELYPLVATHRKALAANEYHHPQWRYE